MDLSQADLGTSATRCAACKDTLTNEYFTANGTMVCRACSRLLEAGQPEAGRVSRALKGLFFGALFGLGGTLIYALILYFSNVQLGLLAILVGWLVGTGVRFGSRSGGLGYQIGSAVLTYVMCNAAFIPTIVHEITTGDPTIPTFVAVIFAMPFSLTVPFSGVMGPIGILILGFGIFQGFKIPVEVPVEIMGPYMLKPAAPSVSSPAEFEAALDALPEAEPAPDAREADETPRAEPTQTSA